MSERPTQAEIDEATDEAVKEQLAPHQEKREAAQLLMKALNEISSLKAQLAESQEVPDGWQLVPIDISNFVLFRENMRRYCGLSFGATKQVWLAVLSAAPTYKKE